MDSPTTRKAVGKTVFLLLGVMSLAALATLWGSLRSVQARRSRDVPATQLPESSLLAKLPAQSSQVFASRPGWVKHASLIQSLLPAPMANSLKNPAPSRWVGGWTAPSSNPMLAAEFPPGVPHPEGWQPQAGLWTYNGQPTPPQKDETAWAPGLGGRSGHPLEGRVGPSALGGFRNRAGMCSDIRVGRSCPNLAGLGGTPAGPHPHPGGF